LIILIIDAHHENHTQNRQLEPNYPLNMFSRLESIFFIPELNVGYQAHFEH